MIEQQQQQQQPKQQYKDMTTRIMLIISTTTTTKAKKTNKQQQGQICTFDNFLLSLVPSDVAIPRRTTLILRDFITGKDLANGEKEQEN